MEFLFSILSQDKPSEFIRNNSDEIFKIIPQLAICKGFNQNNVWHVYDVFEHILHVVDSVPNNLALRLAALFHDIGKPYVYKEDENKTGHFFGHWNKSNEIFNSFAEKYKLEKPLKNLVSNLILYHDLNVAKLSNEELDELLTVFDKDGIELLFKLKQSDLLAQNPKFHYLLNDYTQQKNKLLSVLKLKQKKF